MNATVTYNEETKQFEVTYKDHQTNIDYNKGGDYSSVWKEAHLTMPSGSSDNPDLIGVLKNNNLVFIPNVDGFGQTISSSDNILEQEIKVDQLISDLGSCYVIDEEGSLWSWGDNYDGKLGNGTTTDADTPQKITSINKKVTQLIPGYESCYAIDEDGSIWSWGDNRNGQLGNGTTTDTPTPQKITSINRKVKQLISGGSSCYAIDEEGSIWSWGYNGEGQLGNGTTIETNTPQKITGINKKVTQLIPGDSCYAIDEDGSIWSWGYNEYGELGNGTTTANYTPKKITSINKKVTQLILGSGYCYAIDEDGSIWSWGYNGEGQLGNGTTTDTNTPQKITSINKKVKQLISHWGSCYVIDEEGSIWSWGYNEYGQLGNGTTTDADTPQKITSINKKVTQLISHWGSCYVIDEEGSIWSWGYNEYGQLGNGTTTNNPTPQKITGINKKVTKLIIPSQYSIDSCYAIDEDGSLWSWGNNRNGELGNGTKQNSPTPQKFENTILYDIGPYYSIFGNGKDKITINGISVDMRPG